jgi:hypothetical protein
MSQVISTDAIEINSLVAARPGRVLAVLEHEPVNGLWQLTLSDPEGRRTWRLGHYIDHYESREIELQDELKQERWPEWPDIGSDALAWSGKHVRIVAGSSMIRVEIGAWRLEYPRLCTFVQHALEKPVYLGTTVEGRYFMLDCIGGWRKYFGSLEGLEREIMMDACHCGKLHWLVWHVVRDGEIVETRYGQTRPHVVIEVLRRELGP